MDAATLNEYIDFMSDPKRRKFVEERMGEWEVGDWCTHTEYRTVGCITGMRGKRLFVTFPNYTSPVTIWKYSTQLLRLPFPIDPRNPERGLWGMVDWTKFVIDGIYTGSRDISIRYRYSEAIFCVAQPTLALLRALAAQEGMTS
jgi:hypothetical protein